MTPPTDDLYAFLAVPADAPSAAIGEAIGRTEKRLSGKHGLNLTELSRQRALLLQAKRWLLPDDRRAEYDRSRTSAPAKSELPPPSKSTSAPAASAPKARPAVASAPVAVAAPPPAPPFAEAPVALDDAEDEEDPGGGGLSLGILLGGLFAATLLTFAVSFAIIWILSGGDDETPVEAAASDATTPIVEDASNIAAETETAATNVVRASGDEVVLTPTTAKLIGPNVRLDGAEIPPRIENWTSLDSLEWDFESPAGAIYQATLEYGMKPESEGNRYRIVVEGESVARTVGGGSFRDGAYRDVFFLKIPKRGLTTLRIEPLDVVGGELMKFRSLTLATKQKTYGD